MRNKEIELKFGLEGPVNNLFEIFSNIGTVSNPKVQHLDNTYFDTDTKDLFNIRAGLRIRHADDFSEQTLKVKGENIGGLHRRSEYNLPIEKDVTIPQLQKFPKEAFPENFDVDDIQERLSSVCRINFTRQLFTLELLDSEFEVAHDSGFIGVEGHEPYPINELEIELKKTQVENEDLLNLFSILCNNLATKDLPLLLEPFSKMHRASLLKKNSSRVLDLSSFETKGTTVDYVKNLVISFEQLYGYFVVNKESTTFSLFTCVLKDLIEALKLLRRRNLPAFIKGQNEPVEYQGDLKIIIRLLKTFYKACARNQKKLFKAQIRGYVQEIDSIFKAIRLVEQNTKMFLIPLKLRLLLSLLAN